MPNKSFFPFLGFAFVYLALTLLGYENLTFWLKPFLIPLLIIPVLKTNQPEIKKVLILALFFSWMGDVLLLFVFHSNSYFLLGLISFLLAHLFYILLFFKLQNDAHRNFNRYTSFVLLYLFGFLYFLWESLGEMKIPVMIYAIVISVMLFIAIQINLSRKNKASQLILVGAFFFVVSDSVLAENKFHSPIYLSSFWIMCTYLSAQFLLVYGILCLRLPQKKDAE